MSHGVTDKELEGLSAEERAALESEPSEQEAKAAAGKAEGVVDDGKAAEATAATDDGKAPVAEAKPEVKPAAEAKPVDAKPEPITEEDDVADPPAREREPFAVAFDHKAHVKIEDIQPKIDALAKDYEDGKIDLAEFLKQRDAAMLPIVGDRIAAGISEKSKDQTAKALWDRAVDDFLEDNAVYKKDDVLYDALNERVKRLASDEKNADLSDKQLLKKAHDEIASRFKMGNEPAPGKDPKAAVAAARKPDLQGVPRTLADTPAAADNAAADDEFSEIERLVTSGDTVAIEQALAKMPKDKADRYLRAGT